MHRTWLCLCGKGPRLEVAVKWGITTNHDRLGLLGVLEERGRRVGILGVVGGSVDAHTCMYVIPSPPSCVYLR